MDSESSSPHADISEIKTDSESLVKQTANNLEPENSTESNKGNPEKKSTENENLGDNTPKEAKASVSDNNKLNLNNGESSTGVVQDSISPIETAAKDCTEADVEDKTKELSLKLKELEVTHGQDELGATGGLDPKDIPSGACSNTDGSTSSSNVPVQSVYHVKWIKFKGDKIAIITQNENGPCPLLAIMNALLLKGKLKLPAVLDVVSSGQLMEYLGDCIFENAPNLKEENRLNYEQNMSDAMAVFHKLQTGLDVNVKFTGVSDFEYTRECIVFDLLNIQLYHGWLVDPQDHLQVKAVGNCSYNQLVEKIITQKNSSEESQMTEALVGEEFLSKTSHQLTYHGLSSLSSHLKEGELVVFFRNNHFSTLLKHKDELLLLVTDQGFLTESNVVWETLSNVEGDGHFLDADFRTFSKPPGAAIPSPTLVSPGSDQQVDQDYLVALSLQQESSETQQSFQPVESSPTLLPQGGVALTDHELAMKLQEEEDRQLALMHQQQQDQEVQRSDQQQRRQAQNLRNQQQLQQAYEEEQAENRKKKSDCTIL